MSDRTYQSIQITLTLHLARQSSSLTSPPLVHQADRHREYYLQDQTFHGIQN